MPTITVAQAIPLIKKEGRKNVISLEYQRVDGTYGWVPARIGVNKNVTKEQETDWESQGRLSFYNMKKQEYRAVYYSGLRSVIIKGVLYKIVSK